MSSKHPSLLSVINKRCLTNEWSKPVWYFLEILKKNILVYVVCVWHKCGSNWHLTVQSAALFSHQPIVCQTIVKIGILYRVKISAAVFAENQQQMNNFVLCLLTTYSLIIIFCNFRGCKIPANVFSHVQNSTVSFLKYILSNVVVTCASAGKMYYFMQIQHQFFWHTVW